GGAAKTSWLPHGAVRCCLHRAGLGARLRGLLGNRHVRNPRRLRPYPGVDHLACRGRLADEGIVQSAYPVKQWTRQPRGPGGSPTPRLGAGGRDITPASAARGRRLYRRTDEFSTWHDGEMSILA